MARSDDKTLAMKALDKAGVAYEALAYPVDVTDAVEVAGHLGVPPEGVYKTLVVTRPAGRPLLVMLASNRRLDPKRLAAALGEKRVELAAHAEAERLTRLQVGGISALALLGRGFDVVIDEAARERDWVCVSAGRKGVNLRVAVADLVRITGARWVGAIERRHPYTPRREQQ